MTDTIVERGYLDLPYLSNAYGGGEIDHHISMQVNMVIGAQLAKGMQTNQIISATTTRGMQIQAVINTINPVSMQINQIINTINAIGMQVQGTIPTSTFRGMQVQQIVATARVLGMQVFAQGMNTEVLGMQIDRFILSQKNEGMQFKADTLRHALCGVYLEDGYLSESYLADCMNAFLGMQVNMVNKVEDATGMQLEAHINSERDLGMQALLRVDTSDATGMQISQITKVILGMQVTLVIYNTTQLRLMCTFPSRGTPALLGNNWVASTTATGDYLAKNVNTDIIEQVYRSGPASSSLVTLTCDTGLPQGVPVDTIAILGHNMTTSATVQVQGSQDNFATPPAITFNLDVERSNMYWIAPSLPTSTGQNRYWRFVIQDPTNTSGYVEIGTIVFGAADMFSVNECFVQPLTRGYKHFKDTVPSEGFTTVSNDRALKKFLRLRFEKLELGRGGFGMLDDMLQFARTSLKCLVIPTPEYSSRFAVFAKLTQMPEMRHIDNGIDASYVDLDLEWDESL